MAVTLFFPFKLENIHVNLEVENKIPGYVPVSALFLIPCGFEEECYFILV